MYWLRRISPALMFIAGWSFSRGYIVPTFIAVLAWVALEIRLNNLLMKSYQENL